MTPGGPANETGCSARHGGLAGRAASVWVPLLQRGAETEWERCSWARTPPSTEASRTRPVSAGKHADRARPGRRAAAEDRPGRPPARRAPVRRDQRQKTHAPPRHPDPRGRHRLPHLPICPGRLAASDGASVPKRLRALPPGRHPEERLMSSRWQEGDHSNEDAATTCRCPGTEDRPRWWPITTTAHLV